MDQAKLIEELKQQNREAQASLYKAYADILFGQCLKYSATYDEAQDHLQESFITIFEKIDPFKGKGSFEGWMKRIAINTVLQAYRKKKEYATDPEHLQRNDEIEEMGPIDAEVPLSFLLEIIRELPTRYRLVFNLYVLDGYSHKEIAQMLGISEGTSRSQYARAKIYLQKLLREAEII